MQFIDQLFSNFNEKYLEEAKNCGIDLGLQTVYTPINKIEAATGFRFADYITSKTRSVAVLFNTEFINYFLKALPLDYINNIKFTFFYDCKFDKKQVEDCVFFYKTKLNIEMISIENIKELDKIMAGKKFDIVFSNPPYDRSLHLKIAESALNISDKVIFIHPARWFEDILGNYKQRSTKKAFSNLIKHLENAMFFDVKTACKLFNIAINADLMISIFNKNIENKIDNPNIQIANSSFNKIIEYSIKNSFVKKVENNKKDGWRCQVKEMIPTICGARGDFCVCIVPKNTEAIFYDGLDKNGVDWTLTRKKCGQSQSIGEPFPWSIKFNSEIEARNFKESCICNFFINWIHLIKTDMHVPFFAIPFMNDYTKVWTNEDYCKFFNLTEDECKFMCRNILEYKEKDFIKYGSLFK